MSAAQQNIVEFTVLSDPNSAMAREFGIVCQPAADANEQSKVCGVDLVQQNGRQSPDLSLSRTYIVSKKGEIVYSCREPDHKKTPSHLKSLKS